MRKSLTAIVLLIVATTALMGCKLYEPLHEQQAIIDQLKQEKAVLVAQATQVDAAAQAAAKQAQELKQREDLIRQTIAQVSQQLATATGPAFEALEATLTQLQQQRRALTDQTAAATAQAAHYAALQVQVAAHIEQTDTALADSQARLQALEANLQSQFAGVSGTITQVGDVLQNAGVVGAKPIANTVADLWGLGASLLLGGASVFYRNRAKGGLEIAESLQMAMVNSPEFAQVFKEKAAPTIKAYQGPAAQALVAQAKAAIPVETAK